MKKCIPFLFFFLICFTKIHSQGIILGTVTDSATGNPLIFATVTVFRVSDTSIVTYRITDPTGKFKVPGIPLNIPVYTVISFTGYLPFRRDIIFHGTGTQDFFSIPLAPSAKSLDEVLVLAERPPVRIYKDTIEFNASSFKTLPMALVEDLLRKLPGVEIDREGNIRVNGKRVNRILVDGKFFFGNDPKTATRNLPANMIDKVQVTDDKLEIARNITGDLSQTGTVINLTLKKGIKKGWFGKGYGGYRSRQRYEVGGIANLYRDTLQLSLLGYSNNINRGSFSIQDVISIGGFDRSGINSLNVSKKSGAEGFAINGISFGGLDEGLARSSGAGFNLNHSPSSKFSFYAQYFFGNNHNNINTISQSQQYLSDTILTNRTESETVRNIFTHKFNAGFNGKGNHSNISFAATGFYNPIQSRTISLLNIFDNQSGPLSQGSNYFKNQTFTGGYSHDFYWTKKIFREKTVTLNIFQNLAYQQNLTRLKTASQIIDIYPASDTSEIEQLRRQDLPNLVLLTSANFTIPLSKQWTLRFNNFHQYKSEKQNVSTFENDGLISDYSIPLQSISVKRQQNQFSSAFLLGYSHKFFNLTMGASGLWRNLDYSVKNITSPPDKRLLNLLPTLTLSWKQITLGYSESIEIPPISYLVTIPDSSNPFYLVKSNSFLETSHRQSVTLNWFKSFPSKNLVLQFNGNGSVIRKDFIWSRIIDGQGIQTITPVNAGRSRQFSLNPEISKDFKSGTRFIFNIRISPYISFNQQPLLVNGNTGIYKRWETGPRLFVGLNWNNRVEIRPDYSLIYYRTFYSNPYFTNLSVLTHQVQLEGILHAPGKLIWQSNILYRHNSEVSQGLPQNNFLWNIALAMPILKNQRGQVKLIIYDLLNKNNNYRRDSQENMIVDQNTNVLPRYALITFSYDFQNIGGTRKMSDRRSLFLF